MGSGRCAVRPGIQGRSGVDARQICSPESVITITELSLFPCFSHHAIFAYFMECRRGRSGGGGLEDRRPERPRRERGYLLMSMALLITSGEAARTGSLIPWVSTPDLGSI